MNDFMGKHVAVDAKVMAALLACVAAALADTHAFGLGPGLVLGLVRPVGNDGVAVLGNLWKGTQTRETGHGSPSLSPRHLDPVPQREQMVVRSGQMRGENERQATGRTLGRQTAHAGGAPRADVPFADGLAVTGTETDAPAWGQRAGREPHHQQTGRALFLGSRHGGRGAGHEQVPEVHLVHGDAILPVVSGIGTRAQLGADGHLGREPDNRHAYLVRDQMRNGLVDVAWVARQESSVDDEDLSCAM